MDIGTALLQGTQLLEEGGIAVPRLTAEVLLCHAVRCERAYLFSHPERELAEVEWLHYGRYLHERLKGKPTQYITRRQEFYGREFRVSPDVLIPRPETEHVIEAALAVAGNASKMVDVGCGSGAIAVTLALETSSTVFATDLSTAALAVAAANAARLQARVGFLACDLLAALADRSIDAVISNPPYVPAAEMPHLQREVRDYEPEMALLGGPSGFEIYERIVRDSERVLRSGGFLILELGFASRDRVLEMFHESWSDVEVRPDLAGIPRVLAARFRP
jgi:release factor glutamine methyltransferase